MAFTPAFISAFSATWDRLSAPVGNGLLKDLVGYWPLNELGGANNALDLHTAGRTLSQVASPGADTGPVYATARVFNGSSTYFSRPIEADLQIGTSDFTIAAWLYRSVSASTRWGVTSNGTPAASGYALVYAATGYFRLFAANANGTAYANQLTATSFGLVPLNTWCFVVAWHDGEEETVNISVNNGPVNSASHIGGIYQTPAPLMFGYAQGFSTSQIWGGRIGPVAIWRSTLSPAQRAALYNGGAGLPYSALTA
jgi:hypothetical protein